MEEGRTALKIPENTSDRNDYVQGIGKKELVIILSSFGIAIAMLIFALTTGGNMALWMFAAVFVVAFTVISVRRDRINESLIDKIRFMVQYQKSQKIYFYHKYDVFQLIQLEEPGKGVNNDGK